MNDFQPNKSFHLALIVRKSAPMKSTVSAANDEEKLAQTDRETIWCASNYGPIFGSGYLWALSLLAISATAKAFDTDAIGGIQHWGHRQKYVGRVNKLDCHQWNNGGKMVQNDRIRRVCSAVTTAAVAWLLCFSYFKTNFWPAIYFVINSQYVEI